MPEDLSGLISTEYEEQLAGAGILLQHQNCTKTVPDLESIRKTIGFVTLFLSRIFCPRGNGKSLKVSFPKKAEDTICLSC